jgi:hypothetical protein
MEHLYTDYKTRTHTRLALSTAQSTHILRLGHNNSISYDESSGRGFVTSQPTIAMSNVVRKNDTVYENGTFVVQVTPTGVRLLEHEMGLDDYDQVGSDWLPPNGGRIVAASIHASLIALGVSNGERHELIVLRMVDIKKQSDTVLEVFGQVMFISISRYLHSFLFLTGGSMYCTRYQASRASLSIRA